MKRWLVVMVVGLLACQGQDRETPDIGIGARSRSSPALVRFNSCEALAGRLRQNISEEMRVQLLQYNDYYWFGDPRAVDDMAGAPQEDSGGESNGDGRTEGEDFSGTNNQENGVDEADFVKTDGYFIYVLNGGQLHIFGVPEFGELVEKSATEIEGEPSQMLIADDKLVVFSNVYVYALAENDPLRSVLTEINDGYGSYYRASSLVKLTVLDITDRGAPSIQKELYLEGYLQTGRRVEDTVRMLAYSYIGVPGLTYYPELPNDFWNYDEETRRALWTAAVTQTIANNEQVLAQTPLASFVPALYARQGDTITTLDFTGENCQNFAIAEDGTSRAFTSILSLGLFDDSISFESDHIVSNYSVAYASATTLVLAEYAQDWWWYWNNDNYQDATNIHAFDITTPGVTSYIGSGRIDGTVMNQFNLSEKDGYIRVASTSDRWGRWWQEDPEPTANHVFVLQNSPSYNGRLETVGHVGGIAEGETLWSTRFVGDKGFLVTFQNIDPLWTVDLSNPALPTVVGELEVPGVSTYIHPIEDDKLLTIGYGGNDSGLDWSTALSMFDVSNFAAPALFDSLTLAPPAPPEDGWSYAWSEASYEHKAFQYWAPKQLLAIPLSTYRYGYTAASAASSSEGSDSEAPPSDAGGTYTYEYKSTLTLISVDPQDGLSTYGSIDHSSFYNDDSDWFWYFRDVRRSIFMGDYIYAISDKGITAHDLATLSLAASAALPGTQPTWYYYEGDAIE